MANLTNSSLLNQFAPKTPEQSQENKFSIDVNQTHKIHQNKECKTLLSINTSCTATHTLLLAMIWCQDTFSVLGFDLACGGEGVQSQLAFYVKSKTE